MSFQLFDPIALQYGSSPLWHPAREQLFWYDPVGKRLFGRPGDSLWFLDFNDPVTTTGWMDEDHLIVTGSKGLYLVNLPNKRWDLITTHIPTAHSGIRELTIVSGKADRWGGYWYSAASPEKGQPGALFRYFRGYCQPVQATSSTGLSLCFSPFGDQLIFLDIGEQKLYAQSLSPEEGWPVGDRQALYDFSEQTLMPTALVMDKEQHLWVLLPGECRIVRLAVGGKEKDSYSLAPYQPSGMAFGGSLGQTLLITTSMIETKEGDGENQKGGVLSLHVGVTGLPDYPVIL